jgi:molybdopterin-guanine dinucleotide biosynthesis protein B
MKRLAIAFSGPSGSGKTTLIEKISNILSDDYKVAIIKHDPKDKASFDVKGKDSYRFFNTKAETIVVSPTRTTYFSHKARELDELIELFGDFDILLVEGLKSLPLPRLSIFRDTLDESYFDVSNAIAIDKSVDITTYQIPTHLSLLDLNDTKAIIRWIWENAKEV